MNIETKCINETIILKPSELCRDQTEKELFIKERMRKNLFETCSKNGYIIKIYDEMYISKMGKVLMNTGNVIFSVKVKVDLFAPKVDDIYNAKVTTVIDRYTMFLTIFDLVEICIADSDTTKLKDGDTVRIKITNVVYEQKKFDCTGVVC
jgi:DNA-directed RNA polymerase subunit E'/Rpb7